LPDETRPLSGVFLASVAPRVLCRQRCSTRPRRIVRVRAPETGRVTSQLARDARCSAIRAPGRDPARRARRHAAFWRPS